MAPELPHLSLWEQMTFYHCKENLGFLITEPELDGPWIGGMRKTSPHCVFLPFSIVKYCIGL